MALQQWIRAANTLNHYFSFKLLYIDTQRVRAGYRAHLVLVAIYSLVYVLVTLYKRM